LCDQLQIINGIQRARPLTEGRLNPDIWRSIRYASSRAVEDAVSSTGISEKLYAGSNFFLQIEFSLVFQITCDVESPRIAQREFVFV